MEPPIPIFIERIQCYAIQKEDLLRWGCRNLHVNLPTAWCMERSFWDLIKQNVKEIAASLQGIADKHDISRLFLTGAGTSVCGKPWYLTLRKSMTNTKMEHAIATTRYRCQSETIWKKMWRLSLYLYRSGNSLKVWRLLIWPNTQWMSFIKWRLRVQPNGKLALQAHGDGRNLLHSSSASNDAGFAMTSNLRLWYWQLSWSFDLQNLLLKLNVLKLYLVLPYLKMSRACWSRL